MTLFIKNIQKYIDTIDICKVKMPTRKVFAALLLDKRNDEYTIILNTNNTTINQQRNSVIHELIHYHYNDLESQNNINIIEQRTHKLTKYYKRHISYNLKAYIEHKIKISNNYDAKTGKKLPCRQ